MSKNRSKLILLFLMVVSSLAQAAEIKRYPLPGGSTFPIAAAVEVEGVVFESGKIPDPKNREAERNSRAYWGNTEEQTVSVLKKIEASLKEKDLDMGDVVKMTVFLVGDPEMDGKMDFGGFMKGYTQFFGTDEQPNLPARSAVQVARLVFDNMFVEIEVIAVRSE
jgi:enamine deaminase RidA (YjgF/YER057c/UK114 family)